MDQTQIKAKAQQLEAEAAKEWDSFSAFIRSHPKTGFFIGIVIGVLITHFGLNLVW